MASWPGRGRARRGAGRRAGARRRPGAARGGRRGRGGLPARATDLSPDPARRGARALARPRPRSRSPRLTTRRAARDRGAGAAGRASAGSARAAPCARLRSPADAVATRRGRSSPPPSDSSPSIAAARETYLEALGAAFFAGRLGDDREGREAAEAGRARSRAERRHGRPTSCSMDSRCDSRRAPRQPAATRRERCTDSRSNAMRTSCASFWLASASRRSSGRGDVAPADRPRGRAGSRHGRADLPSGQRSPNSRAFTSTPRSSRRRLR